MSINFIQHAGALTDAQLMACLKDLAGRERETVVELIAHLAVLDTRPSIYAAGGYGSLFGYCTQALGLSEDVACARIDAARACRQFPVILDLLAAGALSVSVLRRLASHLTTENHLELLHGVRGRSLRDVDRWLAERSPQPDRPASIRRVPEGPHRVVGPAESEPELLVTIGAAAPLALVDAPRPSAGTPAVVKPTALDRYRLSVTIDTRAHDALRRLQDLLRREIPDGDPARIVGDALVLLLEKTENRKYGVTKAPRAPAVIRRATDAPPTEEETDPTRYVPRAVRRAVWRRDEGRCAFVTADGRRCTETTFIEIHHLKPYAKGGPPTVENLSLRCRLHNRHEAQLVFGAWPGLAAPG